MNFNNELLLSASKSSFKLSSTHGTEFDKYYKNPKIKEVWDNVWKRDDYTCNFCNFKSKRHQEIHHLNDNHDDNTEENLVTVCPLCHQNFHLDIASTTNGGKIIWLPEFSQQELNYMSRAIFIAIDQSEESNEESLGFIKIARMLENIFLERTIVVEQRFQNGASNPMLFSSVLMNMDKEKYENRHKFIHPFKLLNLRARFPVQTKYWRKTTYSHIPVEKWENFVKKVESDE